jgi:DNA repair protein RecO (recombination protein O)
VQVKTRGIFLHHINYSETSIIARIYTEQFGRQSYLVNGVRGKKSSMKMSFFQPFTLLDLDVYYRQGRDLQRLNDARIAVPFEGIPFDIAKSSQAIFLSEVLLKCLKQEEPNAALFDFLFHAICILDKKKEGCANFHLAFLFQLTNYFGVFPQLHEDLQTTYFDLTSASFCGLEPNHNHFMDAETSLKFRELFQTGLDRVEMLSYNKRQRTVLLAQLLMYFRLHLDLIGELKSLSVLKEVLG